MRFTGILRKWDMLLLNVSILKHLELIVNS